MKIEDEYQLYKLTTCTRGPEESHPKPECVFGSCPDCKDRMGRIRQHFGSLDTNICVTYTSWRRKTENGKTSRQPVVKKAPVSEILKELEEDVLTPAMNTSFHKHLFTARWQFSQYKVLKDGLKANQLLLIMDFAENRKSQFYDEIKSAHFDKKQITLHPVIAFYKQGSQTVRHAVDFISDDIGHDHHAVHHFTSSVLSFFEKKDVIKAPAEVFMFSDGCAAQYKGKGNFADLSKYGSHKVQRIYFGSEHGKSEADSETGTLSRSLDTAVLCQTTMIRNGRDLFEWCVGNMSKDEPTSKRTFIFVNQGEIKRQRQETNVKGVAGSRGFHQVIGAGTQVSV